VAAVAVAALLLVGACSSSGSGPRDAAGGGGGTGGGGATGGGGTAGGDAAGDAYDPTRAGTFRVTVDGVASSFELVSVTWVQTPAGDSYSFEVEAGESGANARALRLRLAVAPGTTAINANCVTTGSGALWLAYETPNTSAFTGTTGTQCSGEFTAIPVTAPSRLTGSFRGVLAQQTGTGKIAESDGFVDVQVGGAAP